VFIFGRGCKREKEEVEYDENWSPNNGDHKFHSSYHDFGFGPQEKRSRRLQKYINKKKPTVQICGNNKNNNRGHTHAHLWAK